MIIESLERLEDLVHQKSIFLHPIRSSDKYHPILTFPVACYGKVGVEEFIVPFRHPDGVNVNLYEFIDIVKKAKDIFVSDKKEFLYSFPISNVKDLKFTSNKVLEEDIDTYTFWKYTSRSTFEKLNCIIPLVKHFENMSLRSKKVNDLIEQFSNTEEFNFFNNIATPVFFLIEQQGLKVTYNEFIELYKPSNPELNIKDNIAYTYYNLYNVTSRPTNSFNNINFAAIPKKEEFRECFIPQNDFFVEFDFDGYHLRLLSEQIKYNFTSDSAHTQLAKLYFSKDFITEEEYAYIKSLNFKALYGNISEDLLHIPFFSLLDNFGKELWNKYNTEKYITTPLSNKVFKKGSLEDMNEKKLLNYLIQSLETARNITILKDTLSFLKNKSTKISLYTYDSILLDFSIKDGKDTLIELQKILSQNNRYPVKFKYSNNLVL